MSSILKALRKLDEEIVSRERESDEPKIKMRWLVKRSAAAPRVMNRLLSIAAVLLLLAGAAWIFVNPGRQQEPPPAKPAVTRLPGPHSPPVSLQPSSGGKPTARRAVKSFSGGPGGRFFKKAPLAAGGNNKIGTTPEPIRQATRKNPADEPNEQNRLTKNTKPPGLILNGVLWSEKPGRRVALINGRYLKEGDTIDGVSVVKIAKDSVTLRAGGEKWTLGVKK